MSDEKDKEKPGHDGPTTKPDPEKPATPDPGKPVTTADETTDPGGGDPQGPGKKP